MAPKETLGAYADDVELVIVNVYPSFQRILEIFKLFAAISNLVLNFGETWLVPLWDIASWSDLRSSIVGAAPLALGIQFGHQAVYLGFCLGPLGPFSPLD